MESGNVASLQYHLQELEIATSKGNELRSLPEVPKECNRVLDVGCGIGQTLIALQLDSEVEAHGVDIDAAAIAYGSQHFPTLRLQVSPGEKLPYPNDYFDLLMCRVALPYMHVPTALREFSRVLRDGGVLWLAIHPVAMLPRDMASAMKSRSVKGVIYRTYTLVNSALLTFDFQVRFPFNRARIESYQWKPALRLALRRAGFNKARFWTEHGNSLASATRASRR